ncbi:hypothetical protein C8R43DRAFT_874736 [Mycena crocata]|nr:hypothetical protein C8R43DRAFT_874736 [Mycena crocata]
MDSFDGTLGALEIGTIGCAFLFGIITVQVYIYQRSYPTDSLFIKIMVGMVWLFELGRTIVTTYAVYLEIIKKFGRPELLVYFPNSLGISILFEGLITFLVEGFFTYRVYRMYRTPYIAIFCWFLASIRVIASTAYFVACFVPPAPSELFVTFERAWSWLVETIQIIGAVVDVVIAVALCTYYIRNKDSTFDSTSKLIDKLLMWAICRV